MGRVKWGKAGPEQRCGESLTLYGGKCAMQSAARLGKELCGGRICSQPEGRDASLAEGLGASFVGAGRICSEREYGDHFVTTCSV